MRKFLLSILSLSICCIGCKKTNIKTGNIPIAENSGLYILNEGLWNMNNSSISYYNLSSNQCITDIFTSANNRGLGDTGNDLQRYGSKLYCVVNTSENIQVMDYRNCVVEHTISLIGKSPRRICFHEGKAYVSCFDGSVVRIDTASMSIEKTVSAGRNPEGICISNGKLYVANTGGYSAPHYDNTVTVIDLSTFTKEKDISVVCNPCRLFVDHNSYIYTICNGNYTDIPSCLLKIDPFTDEVVDTFDIHIKSMAIDGNLAYLCNTENSLIQVFDLTSKSIVSSSFISDGTSLQNPYSIAVNPDTHDVFITDSYQYTVNGDVYCFGTDGKKKFSFEAGLNPSCMVFF